MPWKLTVRVGPRVEHARFHALGDAVEALERRARELGQTAPGEAVDLKYKQFEPVQQVRARLELAGPERFIPSIRAGVDVRGDGSSEAYVGRVRRRLVEPREGETPYAALRRVLGEKEATVER